ncbi:LptF/LptG family permease, partial [Pseudomonas aeruginosa]
VDDLDNVGDKFSMMALLYMQALAIPTRLYDLLPIGLLIGAILALAGLAQRNELVILRVSGVSGMRLLRMLWIVTIPLMIGAALLSEYVTPWAEMKSGEANLMFRGKAGGDRLNSGYWFKEPTANGGTRIINIAALQG